MTLLSEAMDGAGELRRIDPHAVMSLLRREQLSAPGPDEAGRIAARFGAGRYVLGTVAYTGSDIRVSASLYDLTNGGSLESEAVRQGSEHELAQLVNSLARDLVEHVSRGTTEWLSNLD